MRGTFKTLALPEGSEDLEIFWQTQLLLRASHSLVMRPIPSDTRTGLKVKFLEQP